MKRVLFALLLVGLSLGLFATDTTEAPTYTIDGKLSIGGTITPEKELEVNGAIMAGTSQIDPDKDNYFALLEKLNLSFYWDCRATSKTMINSIYNMGNSLEFRFHEKGEYNPSDPVALMVSKGAVAINTHGIKEGYALTVGGKILATELKITVADSVMWPDFVFKPDYKKMDLDKLDSYIKTNNHLPDMPSAKDVNRDGVDVGTMQAKLLQKVEELTLYLIDLKKENDELKKMISNK